jgi:hypothetical protein
MKKQTVIKFTWGSLPIDALKPETMRELRVIANREGATIEQVMSKALHWFLATPERSSAATKKLIFTVWHL